MERRKKGIRRFLESNTKGRDDEEGRRKGERMTDEKRDVKMGKGKEGKTETMVGERVNVL